MVIASFPAGPLAANCYVLATAEGADCVLIDPGMDALDGVERAVQRFGVRPAAVLLTHGHFDHVADAAAVCERYGAGCWIGAADRPWLSDPLAALTPDLQPLVTGYLDPQQAREPERILTAEPADPVDAAGPAAGTGATEQVLRVAGLTIELIPAPGHTPGATLFRTDFTDDSGSYQLLFTGDVLFEGTVGRTDLPGGDPAAMDRTLCTTLQSEHLGDETIVLPGHGRQTTLGRERATNPYLRPADQRSTDHSRTDQKRK